jgi:hypothetical protein
MAERKNCAFEFYVWIKISHNGKGILSFGSEKIISFALRKTNVKEIKQQLQTITKFEDHYSFSN